MEKFIIELDSSMKCIGVLHEHEFSTNTPASVLSRSQLLTYKIRENKLFYLYIPKDAKLTSIHHLVTTGKQPGIAYVRHFNDIISKIIKGTFSKV